MRNSARESTAHLARHLTMVATLVDVKKIKNCTYSL
jgi:hypothetical protein